MVAYGLDPAPFFLPYAPLPMRLGCYKEEWEAISRLFPPALVAGAFEVPHDAA